MKNGTAGHTMEQRIHQTVLVAGSKATNQTFLSLRSLINITSTN